MVDGECIEGCGTVELAVVATMCPTLRMTDGLVADGEAPIDNDHRQVVLLFAQSGLIRHVETYRTDGKRPSGLPEAAQLTVLTTPTE